MVQNPSEPAGSGDAGDDPCEALLERAMEGDRGALIDLLEHSAELRSRIDKA